MPAYTDKQGQYLAFIHGYTLINGRPPAQADMQRFFQVSPPTVHQMVLTLEERGLVAREPGKSRSVHVLLPPDQLPPLHAPSPMGREGEPSQIYQIRVALDGIEPPIWRRILVPGDVTLRRLHNILQAAMGWTNSHLHEFIVEGAHYGRPEPDYEEMRDDRRVRLNQVAPAEGFTFPYVYDYGDGWLHTVAVEQILAPELGYQYPVCVEGKRACPPEDVGGIGGYAYFLEAIRHRRHPEHDSYLQWVGGSFDPEAFDLEQVNRRLRRFGRDRR